jgi:hypothetical protein
MPVFSASVQSVARQNILPVLLCVLLSACAAKQAVQVPAAPQPQAAVPEAAAAKTPAEIPSGNHLFTEQEKSTITGCAFVIDRMKSVADFKLDKNPKEAVIRYYDSATDDPMKPADVHTLIDHVYSDNFADAHYYVQEKMTNCVINGGVANNPKPEIASTCLLRSFVVGDAFVVAKNRQPVSVAIEKYKGRGIPLDELANLAQRGYGTANVGAEKFSVWKSCIDGY